MFSSRQNVFFFFGSSFGSVQMFSREITICSFRRLRLNIIVTWLIYLTQFMFRIYSRLICNAFQFETGFIGYIRTKIYSPQIMKITDDFIGQIKLNGQWAKNWTFLRTTMVISLVQHFIKRFFKNNLIMKICI